MIERLTVVGLLTLGGRPSVTEHTLTHTCTRMCIHITYKIKVNRLPDI